MFEFVGGRRFAMMNAFALAVIHCSICCLPFRSVSAVGENLEINSLQQIATGDAIGKINHIYTYLVKRFF